MLAVQSHEGFFDLAVLKKNHHGDRADVVLEKNLRVGVSVQLPDDDSAVALSGQLVDGRCSDSGMPLQIARLG